jgi:hypothetical protein
MLRCIFCKRPTDGDEPEEHIVPHAMGNDDDELILTDGEVCGDCNTRLSTKDSALTERLALFRTWAGVKTRKGKHAKTSGTNFLVRRDDGDIKVVVDETDRKTIGESGTPKKRVGQTLSPTGEELFRDASVHLGHQINFKFDEGISRPLHKIAFEYAAKQHGRDYVLADEFDELREFILGDRGGFRRFGVIGPAKVNPHNLSVSGGVRLVTFESLWWPLVLIRMEPLRFFVTLRPDSDAPIDEMYEALWECFHGNESLVRDFSIVIPRADGKIERTFRTSDVVRYSDLNRSLAVLSAMFLDPALDSFMGRMAETRVRLAEVHGFVKQFARLLPGGELDLAEACRLAESRRSSPRLRPVTKRIERGLSRFRRSTGVPTSAKIWARNPQAILTNRLSGDGGVQQLRELFRCYQNVVHQLADVFDVSNDTPVQMLIQTAETECA